MKTSNPVPGINKQKIFRWLKVAVLLYCIVGIAVYYLQDKILFHPKPLGEKEQYSFQLPFKEVVIPVDASTKHHLVQFTPADTAVGVVLYFHGNKENVNHYAGAANNFTQQGYETWMVDYPGFGKSVGELSEDVLYAQALQVYKMARSRFKPTEIIIYGRSLGTGVASQLASIRDCQRLILETPYYNMPSLASRYFWMYPLEKMIKYKLPTNQYLQKVTAPVTIFHGTDDGVIPYSNAEKLKEVLKKGDEFITVEGGSHNDLLKFDQVNKKLQGLISPSGTLSTTSL